MEKKNYSIIYIVGLAITTALMLLFLIVFSDQSITLNFTFLVFFWVVKFLSGFGLVLSIANGFLLILDKFSDKLDKRGTNVLIVIQVIIPALLIAYGIYKIISSLAAQQAITQSGIWLWLDNIIYIYGILSLLLNLYIIPLASEQFHKAAEMSKLSFWKKGAKKVARKVKKKYFSLRKNYAKAQVQDQMTVKEVLDLWRNKFAVNLLLVLSIGTIIFMPVAFICVMYWLHLYIFYRLEIRLWEKGALLLGMIWIGIVAVLFPLLPFMPQWGFFNFFNDLFSSINPYFWTVNVFYLAGICLGTTIFIKKLLNLQGITIKNLKLKRRESKIKKLEKEKEELQAQIEEKDNHEE